MLLDYPQLYVHQYKKFNYIENSESVRARETESKTVSLKRGSCHPRRSPSADTECRLTGGRTLQEEDGGRVE